jgi:hypothetical protein
MKNFLPFIFPSFKTKTPTEKNEYGVHQNVLLNFFFPDLFLDVSVKKEKKM